MTNEGTLDRVLRIALGLGLISMVFVGPQSLWGLTGIVLVATGVIGFCPIYRILGIRTKPAA